MSDNTINLIFDYLKENNTEFFIADKKYKILSRYYELIRCQQTESPLEFSEFALHDLYILIMGYNINIFNNIRELHPEEFI